MWNWQHISWPSFEYDLTQIQAIDRDFLQDSGFLFGVFHHLDEQDKIGSVSPKKMDQVIEGLQLLIERRSL